MVEQTPTKGKAVAPVEEKPPTDARSEFDTGGSPVDAFSFSCWSLDAGTFAALLLALPVAAGLKQIRCYTPSLLSSPLPAAHTTPFVPVPPIRRHLMVQYPSSSPPLLF